MPRIKKTKRRTSSTASAKSRLFPKMIKGFHYQSMRPFTMYHITELYQEIFEIAEGGSAVEGFFDPMSYWYPSHGYHKTTAQAKEIPFVRFTKSGTKNYIDVYVYDFGMHDDQFSAMVRMGGPDIKHSGDSDEILSNIELIEAVDAAMIDDPLWKTRNRQMGMRTLNPRRKNPGKGKSALGALILGGIIGHSMKK